ncbi:MAG TPA: DUF6526 family protein [Gemmatimonadales bacterium]|nr:DUF6526 family protein [Gemmatimonadales bacterium]
MSSQPQSFARHARYVTGYHFVLPPLLLLLLGWQVYSFATQPGAGSLIGLALPVTLILIYWYLRAFAVRVQDRVIRLEERLRMAALFPADLQARIAELTPEQLVALRFASDEELADLTRRVLAEGITDKKVIKGAVRTWRGDHLRA